MTAIQAPVLDVLPQTPPWAFVRRAATHEDELPPGALDFALALLLFTSPSSPLDFLPVRLLARGGHGRLGGEVREGRVWRAVERERREGNRDPARERGVSG